MPSWKKVITSGSDASLNTLTVQNGLFGTASWALTSSYTLLTVTSSVSASYSDYTVSSSYAHTSSVNLSNEGLPKRFITPGEEYNVKAGLQSYLDTMYNYGTLNIEQATITLPLGNTFVNNEGQIVVEDLYNVGTINNSGTIIIGTR